MDRGYKPILDIPNLFSKRPIFWRNEVSSLSKNELARCELVLFTFSKLYYTCMIYFLKKGDINRLFYDSGKETD